VQVRSMTILDYCTLHKYISTGQDPNDQKAFHGAGKQWGGGCLPREKMPVAEQFDETPSN